MNAFILTERKHGGKKIYLAIELIVSCTFKLAKPGDTNPTVKLFVVDLKAVEESRQDASEDDRKFISPPANLTQR